MRRNPDWLEMVSAHWVGQLASAWLMKINFRTGFAMESSSNGSSKAVRFITIGVVQALAMTMMSSERNTL
jgi:hypothetical protein